MIYLDTPMSRPQRAIPVAILIRENNRILFKLFLFFKLKQGDFMLTQEQIDIIREGPLYFLESIWFRIGQMYGLSPGQIDHDSFEERKNDLFFLLGKLLDEGQIKIGNHKGNFISGPTPALVEMFRSSFPDSDEEAQAAWFVTECPGGIVWVLKGQGEKGQDVYKWWLFKDEK
ncbi:conserved hypothetical protein [Xylella fastidiosa M12]|nr:conserved hypothetical protein [Xylella fastidiosa M12]